MHRETQTHISHETCFAVEWSSAETTWTLWKGGCGRIRSGMWRRGRGQTSDVQSFFFLVLACCGPLRLTGGVFIAFVHSHTSSSSGVRAVGLTGRVVGLIGVPSKSFCFSLSCLILC
ncbi:hypothetical protein BDZ97DRAFT_1861967 [Flammula alnicola]|nr:hypothetical protein BDZ97DRAFT_1861967 [Flammula alnicola]